MNCPCVDCICVAICRNKTWRQVLAGCSYARNYLFSSYRDKDTNKRLYIELKPINAGYTVSKFENDVIAIGGK